MRSGYALLILVLAGVPLAILAPETTPSDRFDTFLVHMRFMLPGAVNTLFLFTGSALMGLGIGFLAGWGRASGHRVASAPSTAYIETFRGIPRLVIVLMSLVVIPGIIARQVPFLFWLGNINNAFMWGILALGISTGAYQAEVFRSGFQAIPHGQIEAARSIGMNYWQTMRYVTLPQVVRTVLPPLGNEWIIVLKDTSLLYLLPGIVTQIPGVLELTARATFLRSTTFDPATWPYIFLGAAIIYLTITVFLSKVLQRVEERYKVPGLGVQSV